MDIRLVLSSFVLIFLAELGDKTQIAAMASSAGSKAPWSVFVGAASALVLATLLAVLLGNIIHRAAPQSLIKGVAGAIFIIFGIVFIFGAVRATRAVPAPVRGELKPGVLAHLALEMAAQFEETSAEDYNLLAQQAADTGLQKLFTFLAKEEAAHLAHLRQLFQEHAMLQHAEDHVLSGVPAPEGISGGTSRGLLKQAIAHEQSMSDFYAALAQATYFPSLKAVFSRLAEEEKGHLRRLEKLA